MELEQLLQKLIDFYTIPSEEYDTKYDNKLSYYRGFDNPLTDNWAEDMQNALEQHPTKKRFKVKITEDNN